MALQNYVQNYKQLTTDSDATVTFYVSKNCLFRPKYIKKTIIASVFTVASTKYFDLSALCRLLLAFRLNKEWNKQTWQVRVVFNEMFLKNELGNMKKWLHLACILQKSVKNVFTVYLKLLCNESSVAGKFHLRYWRYIMHPKCISARKHEAYAHAYLNIKAWCVINK